MSSWIPRIVVGSSFVAAAIAIGACCKPTPSGDPGAAGAGPDPSATTEPTAPAEPPDPAWKQKCPQATRPESGTVVAVGSITIHETPDQNAKHKATITDGTWVNLLGAYSNWYCVDYPCIEEDDKLCPGWVEVRVTRRVPKPVDAGVVLDAAKEAAPATTTPDAAATTTKDAGKTTTTTTTTPGSKAPPGGRPPGPVKKPN